MDPTIRLNDRVEVVTIFRKQGNVQEIVFPGKMTYKNREITFTKLGMRHETAKGKRMIHVFDMFDGGNCYRLEFDAEALTWTLTAMIERFQA